MCLYLHTGNIVIYRTITITMTLAYNYNEYTMLANISQISVGGEMGGRHSEHNTLKY